MVIKKKIFTEKDVCGEDFDGLVFESCKFVGLTFKFTNFANCTFESCDFSESLLEATGFFGCKFPGSKISFLDFGLENLTCSTISPGIFSTASWILSFTS